MVAGLEGAGYAIHAVVVTRDAHAAIQSQLKWHHAQSAAEARRNIQEAYRQIFEQLGRYRVAFSVTSYESLTQHPDARQRLAAELGLVLPDGFAAWDGNEKWYDDEGAGSKERDDEGAHVDTGFPEDWFPPAQYLAQEYGKRVRIGRERMAAGRAVFCGIARDVEREIPSALARIELLGAAFADYRAIVYENDSSDGDR